MHFFNYNSSVHGYNTRQSQRGDIFMIQTNSSLYGLKSIRYLGAKSWNELPMEIRKLSSKKLFKKKLKAYLIHSMKSVSVDSLTCQTFKMYSISYSFLSIFILIIYLHRGYSLPVSLPT